MSRIVAKEIFPIRRDNRSLEIDRISSHFIKLVTLRPESRGEISMCEKKPFFFEVIGITITKSKKLSLKGVAETMTQGLFPPCSCPRTGSRPTNQISPRAGLATTLR